MLLDLSPKFKTIFDDGYGRSVAETKINMDTSQFALFIQWQETGVLPLKECFPLLTTAVEWQMESFVDYVEDEFLKIVSEEPSKTCIDILPDLWYFVQTTRRGEECLALAIVWVCRNLFAHIIKRFPLPLVIRILQYPFWVCGSENVGGPGKLLQPLWEERPADREALKDAANAFELRWALWESAHISAILPPQVLDDLRSSSSWLSEKTDRWLNPLPKRIDIALGGPYCTVEYPAVPKALWRRRCHHVDFTDGGRGGEIKRSWGRTWATDAATLSSDATIQRSDFGGRIVSQPPVHEVLLMVGGEVTVGLEPCRDGKSCNFTPLRGHRGDPRILDEMAAILLVRVDLMPSSDDDKNRATVTYGQCAVTDDPKEFFELPFFKWGGLDPWSPTLEAALRKWPGGLSKVSCPNDGWKWKVVLNGGRCEILPPEAFSPGWWIDRGRI